MGFSMSSRVSVFCFRLRYLMEARIQLDSWAGVVAGESTLQMAVCLDWRLAPEPHSARELLASLGPDHSSSSILSDLILTLRLVLQEAYRCNPTGRTLFRCLRFWSFSCGCCLCFVWFWRSRSLRQSFPASRSRLSASAETAHLNHHPLSMM